MTITWIPESQKGEQPTSTSFARAAAYGASMINAFFFDQLLRHDGDYKVATDMTRIVAVENDLIPILKELGFFDLFTPLEWLRSEHHGRVLISLLYLRRHPDDLTNEIKFEMKTPQIARLKALMDATISHSRNTTRGGLAVEPASLIGEGAQGWVTDNGIFYPKGTSVATMANVKDYQQAIDDGISDLNHPRLLNPVNDQRFITNSMAFGLLFSFFPPEDWLQNDSKEGRMMPALLLLQQFPEKLTLTAATKLNDRRGRVSKPTRLIIEDTLDAYNACNVRKQQVIKVLGNELRSYIAALTTCNMKKVAQYWTNQDEALLVSSFAVGVKKGSRSVLEFLESAECKIDLEDAVPEINVEWQRGLAHVVVSARRNAQKGEAPSAKVRITSQWRRMDVPSCCQVINRSTENWRTGQWRISSWIESAEIS